jgi:hypothetical protein
LAMLVRWICDPSRARIAQATVAPSGEIAAVLGVLVLPRVSIRDPIRSSLREARGLWAYPAATLRLRAVEVKTRQDRERVRRTAEIISRKPGTSGAGTQICISRGANHEITIKSPQKIQQKVDFQSRRLLLLEGSASIRATPTGDLRRGRVEKSPRNTELSLFLETGEVLLRYTGYKRFTAGHFHESCWNVVICGLSQSCLRHPPPWMGYAGRDSETESALIL